MSPLQKVELYVCNLCGRPLEAEAVIFVRMGKRVTGRKALRALRRAGEHLPHFKREVRRRLECGHHISMLKRPVFNNWHTSEVKKGGANVHSGTQNS